MSIELTWPGTPTIDLDLMVEEPWGTLISFDNSTSPSGGMLIADEGNNYCQRISEAPREVITWANADAGEYTIHVSFAVICGGSMGVLLPGDQEASFTLRILGRDGQELARHDNVRLTVDGWSTAYTH